MSRPPYPTRSKWPLVVKAGNVAVKIYRSLTRGRELFTVIYRDATNTRVKRSFANLEVAKAEAYAAAAKIQSGQVDVLDLSSSDRIAYKDAKESVRPTGRTLNLAAAEYAEAYQILAGAGSVVEAARFFAKHHPTTLLRRSVPQVYIEFLAAKTADNASQRYIQDIRSRLGRFAKCFDGSIGELTTAELASWIEALKVGAVSRNSTRALIITLFKFARTRGYLPKNHPTEAEALELAKESPTAVGIFTPTEMLQLLEASTDEVTLYLAIGAFAGLRHAELTRLAWSEVRLTQGFIEVTAAKAKTAQRRIVPIQPNLKLWLSPCVKTHGLLFAGHANRFLRRVTKTAEDCGFEWPQNALRHSFASYRLAQCKNANEVALEMGNSPRMIFQHYRELVTPADAESWWRIEPAKVGKIVRMPSSLSSDESEDEKCVAL